MHIYPGRIWLIAVCIVSFILFLQPVSFSLQNDDRGKSLAIPFNYDAKLTSDVVDIQPGGSAGYNLDGEGIVVGMWDAGSVRTTHEQVIGRAQNMSNAPIIPHSCHVAGTIIGSGSPYVEAGGMAPKATLKAWPYIPDYLSVINAYADIAERLDVINCSLSTAITASDEQLNPSRFGLYTSHSRQWDDIVYNHNLILVKSAGNTRNNLDLYRPLDSNSLYTSNPILREYYTLSPGSAAKNNIVVGAIRDLVDKPHIATDSSMTDFSSWGPTADGRIKPDVVANGERLLSMGYESDTHYYQQSGTSMSAPVVTGIIALLIQKFRQDYNGYTPTASLMRSLLIHTAIDAGPAGPDYRFGWGLVNARAAADAIENSKTGKTWFITDEIGEGEIIYKIAAPGTNPIRLTLCWTDYPGDPDADIALVNDLDITVEGPGGKYYPWTLNPDDPLSLAQQNKENHLDNIEQIYIPKPEQGEYAIHIKGKLKHPPKQEFSLWADGLKKPVESKRAFVTSTIPPDGILHQDQTSISLDIHSFSEISHIRAVWDKQNSMADIQPAPPVFSCTLELDISKEKKGEHSLELEITDIDNSTIVKSWQIYKVSFEYEILLDNGEPFITFLDTLNNVNYYILTPGKSGWYKVETSPVKDKNEADTFLQQEEQAISDDDSGKGLYSSLTVWLEKDTPCKFKVSGLKGSTGFYAISAHLVSSTPEKVIIPATGPDVEITGEIKDAGDKIFYSFTTPKFGYYTIHPSVLNSKTAHFMLTSETGDIIADTRIEQKIILQPDEKYAITLYADKNSTGSFGWSMTFDTSTSFEILPDSLGKSTKMAFTKPGVYWYEFTTKDNAYMLVQFKKSGPADTPPNNIILYPKLMGKSETLGYFFNPNETSPNPINLYFYERKSSKRYIKINANGKEEFFFNITTFDPKASFQATRNITKKFFSNDYRYFIDITPKVLYTDPAFSSLLLYDFLPKGFDLNGISYFANYRLQDRVYWSIDMDNKNLQYVISPQPGFSGKALIEGKLEVTIPILGESEKKTFQFDITGKKNITIDKPSIEDWQEY